MGSRFLCVGLLSFVWVGCDPGRSNIDSPPASENGVDNSPGSPEGNETAPSGGYQNQVTVCHIAPGNPDPTSTAMGR